MEGVKMDVSTWVAFFFVILGGPAFFIMIGYAALRDRLQYLDQRSKTQRPTQTKSLADMTPEERRRNLAGGIIVGAALSEVLKHHHDNQ